MDGENRPEVRYKNRLLLDRLSSDTLLADGLPATAEYLHAMGILDGSSGLPDIVNAINNMSEDGVRSITGDKHPEYEGRARVVLADVSTRGAVITAHAQSGLYEV